MKNSAPHLAPVHTLPGKGRVANRAGRHTGVVEQVRIAMAPVNRLATFLGFIWGGSAPFVVYHLAHGGLDPARDLAHQINAYFIFGGLIFSAITVYQWSQVAFRSPAKAFGFVLMIEGAMTFSGIRWLALYCLVMLICINGVATACNLTRRS